MNNSKEDAFKVWSDRIQVAFWIILSAAVAFYGNGEQDLVSLVLHDQRLNRTLTNTALVCVGVNFVLFCYLFLWLEGVHGIQDATRHVQWAAPVGGGTFATAVICFILGLWPMFNFLALPIVVVEVYGVVLALHFAPTFGVLRVREGRKLRYRPPGADRPERPSLPGAGPRRLPGKQD